jgi:hypothetical protein
MMITFISFSHDALNRFMDSRRKLKMSQTCTPSQPPEKVVAMSAESSVPDFRTSSAEFENQNSEADYDDEGLDSDSD